MTTTRTRFERICFHEPTPPVQVTRFHFGNNPNFCTISACVTSRRRFRRVCSHSCSVASVAVWVGVILSGWVSIQLAAAPERSVGAGSARARATPAPAQRAGQRRAGRSAPDEARAGAKRRRTGPRSGCRHTGTPRRRARRPPHRGGRRGRGARRGKPRRGAARGGRDAAAQSPQAPRPKPRWRAKRTAARRGPRMCAPQGAPLWVGYGGKAEGAPE